MVYILFKSTKFQLDRSNLSIKIKNLEKEEKMEKNFEFFRNIIFISVFVILFYNYSYNMTHIKSRNYLIQNCIQNPSSGQLEIPKHDYIEEIIQNRRNHIRIQIE